MGSIDDWRAVLADPNTSDDKLLALAGRSDVAPAALLALAADHTLVVRLPAIAGAIYGNPRAPLSVANRVVVTCQRAGVVPDGIPGFEELARAIAAEPGALDPAVVDPGFADLIDFTSAVVSPATDGMGNGETAMDGGGEGNPAREALSHPASAPQALSQPAFATQPDAVVEPAGSVGQGTPGGKPGPRRSATIDFTRLKLYEKIRLATLGNAYCRQNLLRDSNRMVAMAAIRSPQITDGEVAQAAGNRALGEEVIRYIANRKELVKQYPVKLALVGNAKCPLAVALRLLPTLNAEDIKRLARSKNIPGALSVAAKKLAAARGPQ